MKFYYGSYESVNGGDISRMNFCMLKLTDYNFLSL